MKFHIGNNVVDRQGRVYRVAGFLGGGTGTVVVVEHYTYHKYEIHYSMLTRVEPRRPVLGRRRVYY